ncbi:site-specific DNA-methyltransferase [Bifidobacterium primatium]|uniref:site-specific DNA-methyltransferase (adenine-specific) n=1 Tax=Bifidobacterium primatium TaxID=2045438 RepID=A0A2M9H839_9BIFI|nr:BREX-1 system adenine-specific DNA-methyltransferase PglX [Bifidobacterium primatium]PJM72970.1 site-specific DNA-methyltransferase [Bifidobacterium primatium]
MNTNRLQAFAAESRTELMTSIAARMRAALEPASRARADMPKVVARLEEIIRAEGGGDTGFAAVTERYAYRWFNRIIALRYMDVLGYTDLHVVSAEDVADVNGLPQVLSEALRGVYDPAVFEENRANRTAGVQSAVEALIDGTRASDDPQGEAYGLLLQAYCRHWHDAIPSMFEGEENLDRGVDELLMPADLLASGSVLRRALEAMSPEDCITVDAAGEQRGNVEIIGWLYQFYISQRKDEVMAGFKKSGKAGAAEIPAATQLFTPDWIVRYLVQNTVGRLWTQSHPESHLSKQWEYYIPESSDPSVPNVILSERSESKDLSTPESLTVCDPACGSGHMLTYAFDLLYAIYEEQGYSPNEIPALILEHNLYGMEIDERAANLAEFALLMKARDRYRRFFRRNRGVRPHIRRIEPVSFTDDEANELNRMYQVEFDPEIWNTYAQANITGSLIQPSKELADLAASTKSASAPAGGSWPGEAGTEGGDTPTAQPAFFTGDSLIDHEALRAKAETVLTQTRYLARQYMAVVANPPYMGSNNMGAELKSYVNHNYKDGKADLFAAFIYRCLLLVPAHGRLGFMSPYVWMFINSYEKLRQRIISREHLSSLIQLEYSGFDGATVPICTFVLERGLSDEKSCFVRLSDFVGAKQQGPRSREIIAAHRAVLNGKFLDEAPMARHFYECDQDDFTRIPGSPIVYWLPAGVMNVFRSGHNLGDTTRVSKGMVTANNDKFVRLWHEVDQCAVGFSETDRRHAAESSYTWFMYAKGGEFRRWYGNESSLVNWKHDGCTIQHELTEDGSRVRATNFNLDRIFKPGISWTVISSGEQSFRINYAGHLFDAAAGVAQSEDNVSLLGLLNSVVARVILDGLNPTLNLHPGYIEKIPLPSNTEDNKQLIESLISTSKSDWDSFETSWDFVGLPIVEGTVAEETSHPQSAALTAPASGGRGRSLAEIVAAYIERCKRIAEEQREREARNNELVADAYGVRDEVPCDVPLERVSLKRNPAFAYPKADPAERDTLMARDLVKELISYAVGCMFGRYSIDKPGLILASQGQTLDNYLREVPNPRFMPDEDNVIPITSDEWFEDDIVSRFRTFLAVVYGEERLGENVAYAESMLGKSLRKYFVNDFYNDHVKMYKSRPIYWMYSSRRDNKGSFRALVCLHRYTPVTTSNVLGYLRDYVAKLDAQSGRLLASDSARDVRAGEKMRAAITECREYEDKVLYPLATRNLDIDLDDGVLVNYLRLGGALRSIPALDRKRKDVATWTWPHHKLEE